MRLVQIAVEIVLVAGSLYIAWVSGTSMQALESRDHRVAVQQRSLSMSVEAAERAVEAAASAAVEP
ncbi:MAG TPA: hypothetical protein VN680_17205 [Burkholderiaceae bacterium]|jgi:hypothetical protein|nr:hypothetical protein [Burkholderiaceae bacterium]